MAKTTLFSRFLALEPVPTTQSPIAAAFRIFGLQVASVQTPKNGLGAKP